MSFGVQKDIYDFRNRPSWEEDAESLNQACGICENDFALAGTALADRKSIQHIVVRM
jgi:hypothetical protein